MMLLPVWSRCSDIESVHLRILPSPAEDDDDTPEERRASGERSHVLSCSLIIMCETDNTPEERRASEFNDKRNSSLLMLVISSNLRTARLDNMSSSSLTPQCESAGPHRISLCCGTEDVCLLQWVLGSCSVGLRKPEEFHWRIIIVVNYKYIQGGECWMSDCGCRSRSLLGWTQIHRSTDTDAEETPEDAETPCWSADLHLH
ncbi:unnamed protein product [Leuciscus chuanchicus]